MAALQVDIIALAVTSLVTGVVGWFVKVLTGKLDEYVNESKAWREGIERRMDKQDECVESILEAQCTQMRSDITHKIHRYMDDLGCASMEEKQSLYAEYEVYCDVCRKHGIKNHFVERLISQVMELPEREP